MKEFKPYEHHAQYYETDQMGIIHHSNYIRWFEEARVDFLTQAGLPYRELEEGGIASAVIEAHANYRSMVRFGDTVEITTALKSYNSITMEIGYKIFDKETKELRCDGYTKHCFVSRENKLASLKKSNSAYDKLFRGLISVEKVL